MSGVFFGLAIDQLPAGWTKHFDAPYSSPTTVGMMRPGSGDCLLWAAGRGNPPKTFAIAAFGSRDLIETSVPLWHNNVYWYTEFGLSGGFSMAGDVVVDAEDPGDNGLFDCTGRMSWLLNGKGGYRAGCTANLGTSSEWRKYVYFGPAGVFCDEGVCGVGSILKTEGLPNYCSGYRCEPYECCMPARSCTEDVCSIGMLLKLVLPVWCAASLCMETECCDKKPKCTAAVCGIGYHLKPTNTVPPRGQPRNGCQQHVCRLDECCDASPLCPASVCPLGKTLATINPAPFCTSFVCLAGDCCVDAGICDAEVCAQRGFTLRNFTAVTNRANIAANGTVYCDRPTCQQWECCDYLPPRLPITGLWFLDEDLRSSSLGGTLSWVLPPLSTIPNITRIRITAVNRSKRMLFAEQPSSQTWFQVPLGTGIHETFEVQTGNVGGWMQPPAVFRVADTKLVPSELVFRDQDLDASQLGGYLTWTSYGSNDSSILMGACQKSSSIRVEAGYGNRTHGKPPAFFVGDQPVLDNVTVPYGSIVAVELSPNMKQVLNYGVFNTGESVGDSARLDDFLILSVAMGSPWFFATYGTQTFLNTTRLGNFLEAPELRMMSGASSWAMIGVKKWPGPALREQWVDKSHEAPAVVEIKCPLIDHTVVMQVAGAKKKQQIGPIESGTTYLLLPMDSLMSEVTAELVLRSSIGSFSPRTPPLKLVDNVVAFGNVQYVMFDPGNVAEMGGEVSWGNSGALGEVVSYRIYVSGDDVRDRRLVGEVLYPVTKYRIKSGYPRNNATKLLLYSVSSLGEESTPYQYDLSDLGGPAPAQLVAAVVAVAMVMQFAKILEALERAAKAVDSKDISDVPFRGKFKDADGNVLKISGPPPFGAIPWRGPLSQLLGPCGVSHHDKVVKLIFKPKVQQTLPCCKKLPCCAKRARVTKAKMVNTCINAWDNDDLVIKKVSNDGVKIFNKSGEVVEYRRIPARWYKFIRNSRILSRKAIKMYAPMVALFGIAFLIAYGGDIVLAVVLLVTVFLAGMLVFIASKLACTKDLVRIVEALPPKAIRKKFWKGVERFVGILPAAPSFLAGTNVGYASGFLCITGSLLRGRKALALAVIVEGLGGVFIMMYIAYTRATATKSGDGDDLGKNTAVILGAILTMTKAMDTQLENQERLHSTDDLTTDPLMKAAEDAHNLSGMGVWSAVALECFTRGVCEENSKKRLGLSMKVAASGIALRAKVTLSAVIEEIHQGTTNWPKSANQLAYAVGRAIDAAGKDFQLKDLARCKTSNQRQEIYKNLEGSLEELEDSLRQLLNGPLCGKSVGRYRTTVKEISSSLQEATSEFERVTFAMGSCENAGRNARVQVLMHYASLITTTATYVQSELSTGELSAIDLRLLFVKLDQLRKQAMQATTLMAGVSPDWIDVEDAKEGMTAIEEAIYEAMDLMQDLRTAPLPKADKTRLLESMAKVIASAQDVTDFAEDNRVEDSYVVPEALDEAMRDVGMQTKEKAFSQSHEGFLKETAAALSTSRVALGVVSIATQELVAALQKADLIVQAMVQARKVGYRTMLSVTKAREFLQGLSVQQLQKLQKEAIEFTLGAPVQALVNLQETSVDSAQVTHKALLIELTKITKLLETHSEFETKLPIAAQARKQPGPQRTSRSGGGHVELRSRFHMSRGSRVVPEEDEDDDMGIMFPAKLETLDELRESAIGNAPPTSIKSP